MVSVVSLVVAAIPGGYIILSESSSIVPSAIAFASFAWNYRLKHNQIFKFVWILNFPACTLVLYLVLEICIYVSEILCYTLVAFSSQMTVLSAIGIYIVLFLLVSLFFLARRSGK